MRESGDRENLARRTAECRTQPCRGRVRDKEDGNKSETHDVTAMWAMIFHRSQAMSDL